MDNHPKYSLIDSFFSGGKRILSKKDEIIYESNTDTASVFLLKSGYIKSYIISNDGSYDILCIYGPGSIFPLSPTLKGDVNRPHYFHDVVYFETLTEVDALRQPATALITYSEKEPAVYRLLTAALINNYEIYLSRVEGSLLKHAQQRMAYYLLVLAGRFGEESQGQTVIDIPLTHQDVADSLGMARETASRELEKLRSGGLIDIKDRHIIIKDVESLQSIVR